MLSHEPGGRSDPFGVPVLIDSQHFTPSHANKRCQGDGFFVTQGTVDGVTGNFYTRAGQTNLAQDGTLVASVTQEGMIRLPNG